MKQKMQKIFKNYKNCKRIYNLNGKPKCRQYKYTSKETNYKHAYLASVNVVKRFSLKMKVHIYLCNFS